MEAAAAHVIAIFGGGRITIFAVQSLGGRLDEKCRAGYLVGVESCRPGNTVLEEPTAGAVQFVIAQDRPLFECPVGFAHGGRRHMRDTHAPSVRQRATHRRIALHDECREVALQDGVLRIHEARRQDRGRWPVRQRDGKGRERLRHPRPVGHARHRCVPGAALAQRVPAVQLRM